MWQSERERLATEYSNEVAQLRRWRDEQIASVRAAFRRDMEFARKKRDGEVG